MPTPKASVRKNAAMGRVDITPPEIPPDSTLPMMPPIIPRAFCAVQPSHGSAHSWGMTAMESNGTQTGHLAYCTHCLARIWIPS